LLLLAIVHAVWFALLYLWLLAHGVRLEGFLSPSPEFLSAVASWDFLGVSAENPRPSILSLNFEIVMWSVFGVAIRTIFRISVALARRRFDFWQYLAGWTGDMMMGAGLAEVVILFLRITRVSIGSADVSLAEAGYETIAALAFILGFYHEDARRLLGGFRTTLISAASGATASRAAPTGSARSDD
jgi:hypothetical protein